MRRRSGVSRTAPSPRRPCPSACRDDRSLPPAPRPWREHAARWPAPSARGDACGGRRMTLERPFIAAGRARKSSGGRKTRALIPAVPCRSRRFRGDGRVLAGSRQEPEVPRGIGVRGRYVPLDEGYRSAVRDSRAAPSAARPATRITGRCTCDLSTGRPVLLRRLRASGPWCARAHGSRPRRRCARARPRPSCSAARARARPSRRRCASTCRP
jgi:hypothetical protein